MQMTLSEPSCTSKACWCESRTFLRFLGAIDSIMPAELNRGSKVGMLAVSHWDCSAPVCRYFLLKNVVRTGQCQPRPGLFVLLLCAEPVQRDFEAGSHFARGRIIQVLLSRGNVGQRMHDVAGTWGAMVCDQVAAKQLLQDLE